MFTRRKTLLKIRITLISCEAKKKSFKSHVIMNSVDLIVRSKDHTHEKITINS
jgi:hypothetical protein